MRKWRIGLSKGSGLAHLQTRGSVMIGKTPVHLKMAELKTDLFDRKDRLVVTRNYLKDHFLYDK